MRGFLTNLLVTALGLWAAAYFFDGVDFASTGALIAATLVLGMVNAIVRPIVVILTIPITVLTFGIFLLIINGAMIAFVAWIVPGFDLATLTDGIVAWIVVALTNWLADQFQQKKPRKKR
ncbi:MAG: phage holin family protein [Gemmatimonadota bacterium]|nr:phage holin family protein [Gemmatimonadota bacterium]MDH5805582.1 phage holin family protein [Gemmatimonadota bacterium]